MITVTEGIVLHSVKYGESSVIATVFTKEYGRQAYMVKASRNRKSKNKAGLLQPLFLVELETYQKQSRNIQNIKNLKSHTAYQNIPFDIVKSTQAIFLSEMLHKTIYEQESYKEMYDFIKHSLLYFDLAEEGKANFHLYFLLRLTEYIGVLPSIKKTGRGNWLDLKKGSVVPFEPSHPLFAGSEATEFLIKLSSLKINELDKLKIPRQTRDLLLGSLVDYYRLHIENLGEIKSLKILREIFD